ncbi:MAG TPA: coenzyme F430 synthase [Methanoregulaceae archaeon]|nr:coenzyme F430 synthase [Methanoregulaceae archaeon]
MPKKRYPLSDSCRDFIVLDTIHGGLDIARALVGLGYNADVIDVYRGSCSLNPDRHYDQVVAPVHLDPDNAIFHLLGDIPIISHHEITGRIIDTNRPAPMIEVTGSQGKTTTAHAIAHLFKSRGILHTSCGTFQYPERKFLARKSITPASLIGIMEIPGAADGWLVAEESLGVTGAGDIAVITSAGDYPCAGGKKSAFALKMSSTARSPILIAAPGVPADHPRVVHVEEYINIEGDRCLFDLNGVTGHFENPLLELSAYAIPLMMAAATGCVLGISPEPLRTFHAIPGRMAVSRANGHLIVDNANTGTGAETTIEAAGYARMLSGKQDLILVTGQETGAICEGFPPHEIVRAIDAIHPAIVYIVGTRKEYDMVRASADKNVNTREIVHMPTFGDAKTAAVGLNGNSAIVLAVKSWR